MRENNKHSSPHSWGWNDWIVLDPLVTSFSSCDKFCIYFWCFTLCTSCALMPAADQISFRIIHIKLKMKSEKTYPKYTIILIPPKGPKTPTFSSWATVRLYCCMIVTQMMMKWLKVWWIFKKLIARCYLFTFFACYLFTNFMMFIE